jgi:hypothetical protein
MTGELECEMWGGPFDGEIRAIIPGDDGLPMFEVRFAHMPHDRWALLNFTEPVPLRFDSVIYRRGHISEDTHRWRYEFGGVA